MHSHVASILVTWGLRDYGVAGAWGLEPTLGEYLERMRTLGVEMLRVLKPSGTLWLNMGDAYASSWPCSRRSTIGAGSLENGKRENRPARLPDTCKEKELIGLPWRVAFMLQEQGWYLRSDIVWAKPNPMPESVKDRPTRAHEYVFLLTKNKKYWYDADAIAEPQTTPMDTKAGQSFGAPGGKAEKVYGAKVSGDKWEPFGFRNSRSVWTIPTQPYPGAHFATFPMEIPVKCISAGCPGPGKRCDCDALIHTPVGQGDREPDPTVLTGRAGMNRPRRDDEGSRPITRREQRGYAAQMKASQHRAKMTKAAGPAFEHYIRSDESGARPLPPFLLADFLARGWLVEPEPCTHPYEPGGLVLDPFAGSGTTLAVAVALGRRAVGIELNPDYVKLIERRMETVTPSLFSGRAGGEGG